MLLNHQGKTPRDWDDGDESLCPDCGGRLIPKRGRVLIWHWAHESASHGSGPGCSSHETFWHLAWKSVYQRFNGWNIEVPIEVWGDEEPREIRRFRLDAANVNGSSERRQVREFVHSLSDRYIDKHLALSEQAGLEVLWIFDGEKFAAERRRLVRRGGIKHLLKPKARWLHRQIGGLVHFEGNFWKEWMRGESFTDVWYPVESDLVGRMISSFEKIREEFLSCRGSENR